MTTPAKSQSVVMLMYPPDGSPAQFLRSFDLEAHDGLGACTLTPDPYKALIFDSFRAAFETWRASPACRPIRPDGKPNRPLTAFTMEPVLFADVAGSRQ